MSLFEDHLLNGIPLSDAAAFHVKLMGFHKKANAGGMTPPALPPTATGMQMPAPAPITLPGTAMGGNSVKAAGVKTAILSSIEATQMSSNYPQPQPLQQQPNAVAPIVSAPKEKTAASDKSPEEIGKERARAAISAEHEKDTAHKRELIGGSTGSLVGAALGGAAMHKYTKGHPFGAVAGILAGHHIAGKTGREIGAVMDRHAHEKTASAMKRAFEEMQNAGMGMGATSPVDPVQAAQALDQPPAKPVPVTPQLDQATQQYLAMEQQANQATDANAVQFYQQQLAEAREQLEQAQQEAQQLQQGQAMHEQEMQQIQAQVADSTQKTMAATDQVLKEQQGAAAMRMAYQQLRGQILNTVSSDPPMMPSDQAAMSAASTGAAPAPDGGATPPAPATGPAGQAPSPGTPAGSPAPAGDDTVPNADGIASPQPTTAAPAGIKGQADQQKVGSAVRTAYEGLKHRAPYAAAGGALGAATGAVEARHSSKSLKEKHDKLEAKEDRSYGDTKELGEMKSKLLVSEYAAKHPHKFTARSAMAGALAGATMGPGIHGGLKSIINSRAKTHAAEKAVAEHAQK